LPSGVAAGFSSVPPEISFANQKAAKNPPIYP
jgi:hypothetical protein